MSSRNYNQQVSIDEIRFQFDEEVKFIIETDLVVDNSSKINININGYGLEDDYTYSSSYTYLANSTRFYINVANVKSKTLFEVEAYNNLYPELSNTYNFILFPSGEIVDNRSINPVKIDFKNDIIYYDNFNFKNIDKVAEYTAFSSIYLPFLEDDFKGKIKVFISLPVEGEIKEENFYPLRANFNNGKINIDQCYYDFVSNQITYNQGILVKGVNFPVESFTLKVVFDDLGDSKSHFEVTQEYKNTKKFFGECEVSSFCFV